MRSTVWRGPRCSRIMLQSEIAVLRFGLGARPGDLAAAASDPRVWLRAQTRGPAERAGVTVLAPSNEIFQAVLAARAERREERLDAASPEQVQAAAAILREAYQPHYRAQVLARAQSAALAMRPFAERLVHFWANHFAVSADKGAIHGLAGTLENEAIRPHVNGRFVQLLTAVEQHPAMIAFLDNQYSVGTDSPAARRAAAHFDASADRPKRRFGINENLAREILELHTLGVGGGYRQEDVTSFAQILTGWSIGGGRGRLAGGDPGKFYFRGELHEPGAKMLLGKRYAEQGQAEGEAALADLAAHPSTARFLATKLVRHFVSDDPPPAAVERLGARVPEIRRRSAAGIRGADRIAGSLGAAAAQIQDTGGLRVLDPAGARADPGQPAGGHSRLRADGAAPVHPRIARGLGRYGGELGWLGRADAPSALGLADGRPISGRDQPGDSPARHSGPCCGRRPARRCAAPSSGPQALALLLMSPEFQRR